MIAPIQFRIPGCGIYETRFPICREIRLRLARLDNMDENWRPDRSGVLITLEFSGPLNGLLGPAIHARDLGEVKAIIAEACAALQDRPPVLISSKLIRAAAPANAP